MAEELDRMHRSFGGIFSNDLFRFRVHSSPEVHANDSTVRSASGVAEVSNGHEITHSAREHDIANAARSQ